MVLAFGRVIPALISLAYVSKILILVFFAKVRDGSRPDGTPLVPSGLARPLFGSLIYWSVTDFFFSAAVRLPSWPEMGEGAVARSTSMPEAVAV